MQPGRELWPGSGLLPRPGPGPGPGQIKMIYLIFIDTQRLHRYFFVYSNKPNTLNRFLSLFVVGLTLRLPTHDAFFH